MCFSTTWSGQRLVGSFWLGEHSCITSCWWWELLCWVGDLCWLCGKRRTRVTSSSPPQRAEKQPSGDGLPSTCPHLCIPLLVPSSPLLSHAVQQGRSALCQGLEAYQKCISLWKVVWNSHKKRFIVFLSSSWAGVAVQTFFFLSLSPFWHLTVWLLAGAWEARGLVKSNQEVITLSEIIQLRFGYSFRWRLEGSGEFLLCWSILALPLAAYTRLCFSLLIRAETSWLSGAHGNLCL